METQYFKSRNFGRH